MDPFIPIAIPFACACGSRWQAELLPQLATGFPDHPELAGVKLGTCSQCADSNAGRIRAVERVTAERSREDDWQAQCPIEHRTKEENGFTDEAILRAGKYVDTESRPVAYEDIVNFANKGDLRRPFLYLVGAAGTRKTRLAWRAMRAAVASGQPQKGGLSRPRFWTAWGFQSELQTAAGKFEAPAWMRDCVSASLAVLDDLGKCEWTDNTAAAFFELLDQRAAWHRPTLITSNLGGKGLREWMEGARSTTLASASEPILRRLREYGRVVVCQ